MVRIVLHAQRLSVVVGVAQNRGHEVVLHVDAAVVAERERPVPRGVVDGPPEVDDLEAVLEQLGRVRGREVAHDARRGGLGRLVDVHLRHGLALLGRVVELAGAAAADGCGDVISSCKLHVVQGMRTVVKGNDPACAGDLLHQGDALRVVLSLNFLVVRKRSVLLGTPDKVLEAGGVERDGVLLAANVLDLNIVRDPDPVLLANSGGGVGVDVSVRPRAVRRWQKVDELGGDGAGSDRHV